jgi:hypothetical protein
MAWYNFWKKPPPEPEKVPEVESSVFKSQWRNNMWVMTKYGVGILFDNSFMATIHLVDTKTGETIQVINAPFDSFRQAKLEEIPPCRRNGITKERADYLGYF